MGRYRILNRTRNRGDRGEVKHHVRAFNERGNRLRVADIDVVEFDLALHLFQISRLPSEQIVDD